MNGEDKELEEIKRRKFEELLRRRVGSASTPVSEPIEVTDLNFNDVLRRSRFVVIDCWAPWCPPCRAMAPIIDELAKKYAGKILFGKLNVDENQMVPIEYQIMSIPTFLIFKDGVLVDRIVGAMPRKALEQRLVRYIES
jgi:thioredoxin 1